MEALTARSVAAPGFEEKTAGSGSTRVIRGVTRWRLEGYNHLHAGGWSFFRLPWSARSGSTARPTATLLASWVSRCRNYPTQGRSPHYYYHDYYYAGYYHADYYHADYYYALRHTLDWLPEVAAAPPRGSCYLHYYLPRRSYRRCPRVPAGPAWALCTR